MTTQEILQRSSSHILSSTAEAEKLWQLISVEESADVEAIQHAFARHVCTTLARTPVTMDNFGACQAAMYR
jgi:hypothetical protein